MEVGLSGIASLVDSSGWDVPSRGAALAACAGGCSPAYTGSKVSSGRGCKTCSALLDVQPRYELSNTSDKAM